MKWRRRAAVEGDEGDPGAKRVNQSNDPLPSVARRLPGAVLTLRLDAQRRPSVPFATAVLDDLLGLRAADLAVDAMPFFEHVALADAERVFDGLLAAARDDTPWHAELAYDHPTNGTRRLEIWAQRPAPHADGGVELCAFAVDVTDHHRAAVPEAIGVKDDDRVMRLLDAAMDGFLVLDRRGQILQANDATSALTGFGRVELLRMRFEELKVGKEVLDVDARLTRIARDGAARFETRLRRHGGRTFEAEVSARFLDVDGGRFVVFLRDITKQRRMERDTVEGEQRFGMLLRGANEGIWLLDADRQVLFWSAGATRMLGWELHEVVGHDVRELGLTVADDAEKLEEALTRVTEGGRDLVELEVRFRRKDGESRTLAIAARNLLDDSAVRGIVVNAHDVTELRVLEDALRRGHRLECVGRLASGITHDFNNLMTVILGGTDVVRAGLARGERPSSEHVDTIYVAAGRARTLARQLLAVARREAGAPGALDLNDLVTSSERLLRSVLGEEVELVLELRPGLGAIACDPAQMEQVLLNLVVNARDAMPCGGTIAIRTSERREGGRELVRLSMQDSGEGMSAETQAHLFEPFFTTKEASEGSGLGLATVHGIVTHAGGTVRCESAPGRGTTFDLEFPLLFGNSAAAEEPVGAARPTGTETILVVEDEPQLRVLIHRALRGGGYRTLAAGTAKQALDLAAAEQGHLHLIICDVVLPGLLGPEIVERIRERRPRTRVLFISGYHDEAIAARTVRDSGVDFLAKPFTLGVLAAKVRANLDRA
jgi:PAS domain S-box-containing protein